MTVVAMDGAGGTAGIVLRDIPGCNSAAAGRRHARSYETSEPAKICQASADLATRLSIRYPRSTNA